MAADLGRLSLVAAGGAAGALCRYGVATVLGGRSFPYATLLVNVSGSFALGILVSWGAVRLSPTVVVALGAGFLGAFTTYSTFALDAVDLERVDRPAAAAVYVAASVLGGVLAAGAGLAVGRSLTSG